MSATARTLWRMPELDRRARRRAHHDPRLDRLGGQLVTEHVPTAMPENAAYRMLLDAIGKALQAVHGRVTDERVHDARKAVKKARAALRLLRGGLGEQRYRRENAALRDAGRLLSPLRDARVLVSALDELKDQYPDELRGLSLSPLRRDLRRNLTKARDRLRRGSAAGLRRCAAALETCRDRLTTWHGTNVDDEVLWDGLRKLYRKGRKVQKAAETCRTSEAFHEWRKQVKYLLNAIEALHEPGLGLLSRTRKQAEALADRLGEDHDLAVLRENAAGRRHAAEESPAIEAIQSLIQKRRTELQKGAIRIGEKLFDTKPREFIARMSKHARFAAPHVQGGLKEVRSP